MPDDLAARSPSLPAPPAADAPDDALIGSSPRMRVVFDFARIIRNSESNVLIIGETGTGKEAIARLLHRTSPRRARPFVAVSCAILTETLIESELFGHDRGAFTGAVRDRPGRFELADTGTIFLDDIDDVPPSVQIKLLRVVQQRVVDRVGGTRSIPVDVRVVTGSKRSLRQMVAEGRFRADLYYRLNVLPVWLPPLRERREDIPLLTDHFMRRFFGARGAPVPELSETVRQAFLDYSWPGNVRELENACERIAQTCRCPKVRFACMPASILFNGPKRPDDLPVLPVARSLDDRLQQVEAELITTALQASHGNTSRAAELLGIKRSTLADRIRRLSLDPARHR
jgi:transcriptional regulator with GAF, ATPase, and Fis domain